MIPSELRKKAREALKDNWGKVKTTGTVIDFEEIRTGGGIEYWPIIQFNADGSILCITYS